MNAAAARRPRGERPSPGPSRICLQIRLCSIYIEHPKFLVKHDFVRHRSNTPFPPHEEPGCHRHWETRSGSIAGKRAIPWTNWRREPIPAKATVWELENRDTRKPSGEKLTRIAEALSVTTDYLLDESAEPNENVLREAFFRKFNKLDPNDQKKIEQMIDVWRKKS